MMIIAGPFAVQPAEAPALVKPPDRFRHQIGLGGAEPAERLVQQEQLRVRGHGPGHLQPLQVALREGGGLFQGHVGDAGEFKGVHGLCLDYLHPFPPFHRPGGETGDHDIGDDGQAPEGPHVLKGAGDTHIDDVPDLMADELFPLEADASRIGFQYPGEKAQQGGLARPVGADEAQDLLLLDAER